MKQRFFFYGTLSHEVESGLTKVLHEKLLFVGRAFVVGRLFAIPWDGTCYSAIILDETGYRVYGNIYETKEGFSAEDLKELDDYEEYYPANLAKSEYVRQTVQVNIGEEKAEADVYLYNKSVPTGSVVITHGDFMKFRAQFDL